MKKTRLTMAVALLLTSVVACSSTPFPYKRFFPDFKNMKNPDSLRDLILLGAAQDGSDDFSFFGCIRRNGSGAITGTNCVVVSTDEWQKMRLAYADAQRKLKSCK
jgi:hypothetical protein